MLNLAQLSRIDLNLLVLFQAVFEEKHVGRAAGRLNLTPSAVSHGLKRLRAELQDPLFLRTPKGVVATARAEAVREPIAEILNSVQGVLGMATPFDSVTSTRRFVVAAPDAVLASLTMPFLECISATAPFIDIGLMHVMPVRPEGATGSPWVDSLARLEKREIDVALLPIAEPPARFEARLLYEEEFVVAMRRGHPYSRAPTEREFCTCKHVLVSLGADPHGFIDDALAKRGRKRRIFLTVPTFMMALAHVADSDLIAVLPRRLVRQYADRFQLMEAALPIKHRSDPIKAVVTKSALMDEGIAWLLRVLAGLFAADSRRVGRRAVPGGQGRPALGYRPR